MDVVALRNTNGIHDRGYGNTIREVTASANIEFDDDVIVVDSSAGDVTLTLVSAGSSYDSTNTCQQVWRVVHAAGSNNCYITRCGSDTIDETTQISVPLNGMTEITAISTSKFITSGGRPASSLTIALPFTLGNRSGPNSDGVMVGTLTHTAFTDVTQEDNSAGTFTDETTDAGDAGADDVEIPDPFDTSDALYMVYSAKYCAVVINVGTQGAGDAVAAETIWEYSKTGSTWGSLEAASYELVDDSTALTAGTSTYVVSFVPPSDWATISVDSGPTGYGIRMRATADDVYNTTQPLITQMWCVPLTVGDGIRCPASGTITKVDLVAGTASGTADDTELLLVNITKGTFQQLTWTGGDTCDQVAGSLVVSQGDELAMVVTQEDGTTEFADGALYLIING